LPTGEFTRRFTPPIFVDVCRINGKFKDVMSRVTLPKREEAKPSQKQKGDLYETKSDKF
jgi:hypothetical protein